VRVILAPVDKNLRAKRTLNVGLLWIDFRVFLWRGFVLETGLEMDLQASRGAEKFGAVVTGHPVCLDQLFPMPLVNVKLKVVVVKEGHGAVGTSDLFFCSFHLLGYVFILFPVRPGCIGIGLTPAACLVKLVSLRSDVLITGLAVQPVG
jgi:hypothetical protein